MPGNGRHGHVGVAAPGDGLSAPGRSHHRGRPPPGRPIQPEGRSRDRRGHRERIPDERQAAVATGGPVRPWFTRIQGRGRLRLPPDGLGRLPPRHRGPGGQLLRRVPVLLARSEDGPELGRDPVPDPRPRLRPLRRVRLGRAARSGLRVQLGPRGRDDRRPDRRPASIRGWPPRSPAETCAWSSSSSAATTSSTRCTRPTRRPHSGRRCPGPWPTTGSRSGPSGPPTRTSGSCWRRSPTSASCRSSTGRSGRAASRPAWPTPARPPWGVYNAQIRAMAAGDRRVALLDLALVARLADLVEPRLRHRGGEEAGSDPPRQLPGSLLPGRPPAPRDPGTGRTGPDVHPRQSMPDSAPGSSRSATPRSSGWSTIPRRGGRARRRRGREDVEGPAIRPSQGLRVAAGSAAARRARFDDGVAPAACGADKRGRAPCARHGIPLRPGPGFGGLGRGGADRPPALRSSCGDAPTRTRGLTRDGVCGGQFMGAAAGSYAAGGG